MKPLNYISEHFHPSLAHNGGQIGDPVQLINVTKTEYMYKYNGQEWQDELGLNMYAMDMRQYDPAIGRWVVQDPVIHHSMSPYNSFDNNPVFWADPSGADATNLIEDIWDKTPNDGFIYTYNNKGKQTIKETLEQYKSRTETNVTHTWKPTNRKNKVGPGNIGIDYIEYTYKRFTEDKNGNIDPNNYAVVKFLITIDEKGGHPNIIPGSIIARNIVTPINVDINEPGIYYDMVSYVILMSMYKKEFGGSFIQSVAEDNRDENISKSNVSNALNGLSSLVGLVPSPYTKGTSRVLSTLSFSVDLSKQPSDPKKINLKTILRNEYD